MKRKMYLVLLLVFALLLSVGCNKQKEKVVSEEKQELVVFAAASLTESLEEIKKVFEEENPGISLVYTFDSSGTLKTQIQEGAECDVFISAAHKQMDAIDPSVKGVTGENLIKPETRMNLLENKVVLATTKGNPKGISDFMDLATDKVDLVALGNDDVPVGQYSKEILHNLGIWDGIQDKVTFGSNVKEVTTWVKEAVADCGIVYQTDAFSAGLEVIKTADESMLNTPVIYPAAILDKSKNMEVGEKFLSFLNSEKAEEIFSSVGFNIAE